MSHSKTVQTRRKKMRARRLLVVEAKRSKKLKNAKPGAAPAAKSA